MAEELETKVEETVEAAEVAENVETADNKKEANGRARKPRRDGRSEERRVGKECL